MNRDHRFWARGHRAPPRDALKSSSQSVQGGEPVGFKSFIPHKRQVDSCLRLIEVYESKGGAKHGSITGGRILAMAIPTSSQSPVLDAKHILDINYAFAQTAMLMAAVRLHVFTTLAERPLPTKELADRIHVDSQALERLLQGLRILQLVSQAEDRYQLTPLADHFLVEGKSSYLGGDTLAMLDYIPAWFQLEQTLQTGIPYRDLGDASTAENFYAPRVRDLFPIVYPIAHRTASELKLPHGKDAALQILDIGAGSAPWSVAFAQVYPSAHVTALDLPAVVEQGQQQTVELGLQDHYTWIAESMETYTYPPLSYDLIIVAHVLRFISEERAKKILLALAKSLRPHGTLIVADVFMTSDRQGPTPAITLDLSMLVNTQQGQIHPWHDVAHWLDTCGLQHAQSFQVAGPFPIVFAQKAKRL
jgi:precorrin-6B methylase 2